MLQLDLIHQFLDKNVIAVVGPSRKGDLPANHIFKKFKEAGYETYPINPGTNEIEGSTCYPSIRDTPKNPEAILLGSTPEVSEKVIDDCINQKIDLVWMHRGIGRGSYSDEATDKCKKNGISAITNGCPLMFLQPVDGFHRIFKWFKNW